MSPELYRGKVTLIVDCWSERCSEAEEVWESLGDEYGLAVETVEVPSEYGKDLIEKYGVSETPAAIIDSVEHEGVHDPQRAMELVEEEHGGNDGGVG